MLWCGCSTCYMLTCSPASSGQKKGKEKREKEKRSFPLFFFFFKRELSNRVQSHAAHWKHESRSLVHDCAACFERKVRVCWSPVTCWGVWVLGDISHIRFSLSLSHAREHTQAQTHTRTYPPHSGTLFRSVLAWMRITWQCECTLASFFFLSSSFFFFFLLINLRREQLTCIFLLRNVI